jgi:hypothetical protein
VLDNPANSVLFAGIAPVGYAFVAGVQRAASTLLAEIPF